VHVTDDETATDGGGRREPDKLTSQQRQSMRRGKADILNGVKIMTSQSVGRGGAT
jgi:hypothetical protein